MAKSIFLSVILSLGILSKVAANPLIGEQQDRLYRLTQELRCLVCQNQSLADSNAPLAIDLRMRIEQQIQAGFSDEQIKAYLKQRYGDFIFYKPPFYSNTGLLWCTPGLLLLLGLIVFILIVKKHRLR